MYSCFVRHSVAYFDMGIRKSGLSNFMIGDDIRLILILLWIGICSSIRSRL